MRSPLKHIVDIYNGLTITQKRNQRISQASAQKLPIGNMNRLAQQLHPEKQRLIIESIQTPCDDVFTYRLVAPSGGELAYFLAGQHLSVHTDINSSDISRPYAISSSPNDALSGFYEISIKKVDDGFFSAHATQNWKLGTEVTVSDPTGNFYIEPLRDSKKIIALAGGIGITPFRSMAKQLVEENLDFQLTLIYGVKNKDQIVYKSDFDTWATQSNGKFKVIYQIEDEPTGGGFITKALLQKHADVQTDSFFICGPTMMNRALTQMLKELGVSQKRIRKEPYGISAVNISQIQGYPLTSPETFQIMATLNGNTQQIPAISNEPILVAFERAGIGIKSDCRAGECGFCRSKLVSGEVFIIPDNDGRRMMDKKHNYIHPCATFPLSNLNILL